MTTGSSALLVLAGRDLSPGRLAELARQAPLIVATDGAADWLAESNIRPHVAIGDFDSHDPNSGWALSSIHLADQDTTDTEKALDYLDAQGVRSVIVAGLEGDRLDHVLASLDALARCQLQIKIALRMGTAWLLRGPVACTVPSEPGDIVSVLARTDLSSLSLSGVAWQLRGQDFQASQTPSISNRATGAEVRVTLQEGIALLVVGTDAPVGQQ